jgi:hypothetical protein
MLHPATSERAGWHESCYYLFLLLLSYYCVFDEKKQMNYNCNFKIINQSFLFQQFSLPAYSKSNFCKQLPIAVKN